MTTTLLDDGSQWHELFGYRVRQTSAFFMLGNMLSLVLVNLVVIAILTLTAEEFSSGPVSF